MNRSSDPQDFFQANPLSPDACVIDGQARNGKPCRIVDNTGTVPLPELRALLEQLIEDGRFGISGRSQVGDGRMLIGAPEFTHLQIGESVYRFILFPYEARIEAF
ncbi:hypothetical protein [Acidihalobacter prosperus]|uniref:Uncharacterized protein n=1 Tax=Acidihalobacter prosperus TaxID=160660 RepID=A0A1A6C0G9_9GAMM|nr:hypothetical protein [Acidihalobacter prosperus]OBS08050.1 hypothetical protein Thpro_022300 [Acidihalobacter prosperus]